MMQVHSLFYGSGMKAGGSAKNKNNNMTRAIIECQLIEEYHWLPQDLEKIPYKKLQTLFMYRKQKSEFSQHKANIDKFKSQAGKGGHRGGMKKFYRDV